MPCSHRMRGVSRSVAVGAAVAAIVAVGLGGTAASMPEVTVVVFEVPTPSAAPTRLAPGPDGAMWFWLIRQLEQAESSGRILILRPNTEEALARLPAESKDEIGARFAGKRSAGVIKSLFESESPSEDR